MLMLDLCFIYNKQPITWSLIYWRAYEYSELTQSNCLATPICYHHTLWKFLTSIQACLILVRWHNVKVAFSESTPQALSLRE